MNEHGGEPIRGLPAALPEGETLLWQGSPEWRSLALRAIHVRKVAIYCTALLVLRAASGLSEGEAPASIAMALLILLPLAAVAVGLLALFAFLSARTTVYTITTRRVIMRLGIALPATLNLPFSTIGAAGVKVHADGTGDIPLSLGSRDRIAYLLLWPHARRWRFSQPEPMLRSIPQAAEVAQILGHALADAAGSRAEAAQAPAERVRATAARGSRVAAAA